METKKCQVCGEPGHEYTTGLIKGIFCDKHYFILLIKILGSSTVVGMVIYLITLFI